MFNSPIHARAVSQLALLPQYIAELREAKAACDTAGEIVDIQGHILRIENLMAEIRSWLPHDKALENWAQSVCDTADNLFSGIRSKGNINPADDERLTAMANLIRQMLGYD